MATRLAARPPVAGPQQGQHEGREQSNSKGKGADWLRFGEGGKAAAYRVEEGAAPVDFELARAIGALSPAHQVAVRALVKALKRGEAAG